MFGRGPTKGQALKQLGDLQEALVGMSAVVSELRVVIRAQPGDLDALVDEAQLKKLGPKLEAVLQKINNLGE